MDGRPAADPVEPDQPYQRVGFLVLSGAADRAVLIGRERLAEAEQEGETTTVVMLRHAIGMALGHLRQWEPALAELAVAADTAARIEDPALQAVVWSTTAWTQARAGRPEDGLHEYARAHAVLEQEPPSRATVVASVNLAMSALQLGLLDGFYTGATAVLRLVGGHLADRWGRPKSVATLGYGLSAATRIGMLGVGASGLGMVQVYVGRDAFRGSYTGLTCSSGPPCETVTVGGVEMRVQRSDGTTSIYHVQPDGDRVFLYLDPLFGNNSLTPLESLDFPLRTLAAAVSDPAFTTPTQRQVDGASTSFGWPDF